MSFRQGVRRLLAQRIGALLGRFRADTVGAVAVIVALTAPALIGAMGLGTEVGYWYLTRRSLQNAADSSASGAARRMLDGATPAEMDSMADHLVDQAGIDMSATTVVVNSPPASGSFAGNADAVAVTVTETVPRLFSAIYSSEPVPITARAVALTEGGGIGCVLALQGAITVSGSSSSTFTLCDMVSNATGTAFVMSGNGSSVTTQCVQTVGTADVTGNLTIACDQVRENADPVSDPFAAAAEPALTGACQTAGVGQSNQTTTVTPVESHASGMPSRRYCSGLNVSGTVVFEPGLYLIEGGTFRINSNAQISGDGVVFFLAPAVDLHFNGTATVDLSAPTSGTYAGILIFGSRASTSVSHTINGNLGSTIDGAIYTPSSHLTISGNAQTSASSCTQFVTGTISFTGNGTIDVSCANPAGPSIRIAGIVSLVE